MGREKTGGLQMGGAYLDNVRFRAKCHWEEPFGWLRINSATKQSPACVRRRLLRFARNDKCNIVKPRMSGHKDIAKALWREAEADLNSARLFLREGNTAGPSPTASTPSRRR